MPLSMKKYMLPGAYPGHADPDADGRNNALPPCIQETVQLQVSDRTVMVMTAIRKGCHWTLARSFSPGRNERSQRATSDKN
jgi:hypothetical protein